MTLTKRVPNQTFTLLERQKGDSSLDRATYAPATPPVTFKGRSSPASVAATKLAGLASAKHARVIVIDSVLTPAPEENRVRDAAAVEWHIRRVETLTHKTLLTIEQVTN